MRRPLLLDLFCGAGGAARGYHDAGFNVVGVDVAPQPRYPYEFVQADALAVLADLDALARFDAIHASPPCQAYTDLARQSKREYPDLIRSVRAALVRTGVPWVIENVEGAPLRDPTLLCGTMFPDLRVYRHRLFEASFPLAAPAHPRHTEPTFTYDRRKRQFGRPLDLATMRVQVTGGGNAPVWAKREAMGIDWMTGREVNEAIPPAYAAFVGGQLLEVLAHDQGR